MGTCKAWLQCGQEYLLQRVVRITASVVRPVVVAARVGQSLPPLPGEVPLAYDAVDDGGPLAGIEAGINALQGAIDNLRLNLSEVEDALKSLTDSFDSQ